MDDANTGNSPARITGLGPAHHHLQVLGTHSAAQGMGHGSRLLQVGIDRATKAGVPCYLESSNPKNIPFYKRYGFRIVKEIFPFEDKKTGDKGPVATLMLRDAKAE